METTITGSLTSIPAVLGQIGPFTDDERRAIVRQLQAIFPESSSAAIERVVFGPRTSISETLSTYKPTGKERAVFNWLVSAYETGAGTGPYKVGDVQNGTSQLRGVASLSYSAIEQTLKKFEKRGLVRLETIPAGMIDKFWILP